MDTILAVTKVPTNNQPSSCKNGGRPTREIPFTRDPAVWILATLLICSLVVRVYLLFAHKG